MEDWRTQFLKPRSLRGFYGDIVAWCSEWGVEERIAMDRRRQADEYMMEKERKRAMAHPQYAQVRKREGKKLQSQRAPLKRCFLCPTNLSLCCGDLFVLSLFFFL